MVLEKITACGNSPRLYPSPNDQNLQCSCSPDHEKEMGYAVLEIFFCMKKDFFGTIPANK